MDKTEHSTRSCFNYFLYQDTTVGSTEDKIQWVAYYSLWVISVGSITLGTLYLTKVLPASAMLPCLFSTFLIPYLLYRATSIVDTPKWFSLLCSAILIYFVYNQTLSLDMAAPLFFINSVPVLSALIETKVSTKEISYEVLRPKRGGLSIDGTKTLAFAAFAYLLLFTKTLTISTAAPSFLGLATLSLISTSYFNEHNPRYVFLIWLVNAAACALVFFNQLPPEFLIGMALAATSLYFGSFLSHVWNCRTKDDERLAISNFT